VIGKVTQIQIIGGLEVTNANFLKATVVGSPGLISPIVDNGKTQRPTITVPRESHRKIAGMDFTQGQISFVPGVPCLDS